ncbi:hypothetical protein PpBr36_05292 [Pyricularia pennisetigena]|uniref:hypothetical protein n=1 Tax=Pyricularia pennisetigena TaxID=1578925 RepID=UPI00115263AB|nr:hypothetical protein PpBr36_05292 [Pyricularia pennisetigena]TLS27388.1 hypothetical protein PpBr36_05292 [Pyricularia pennisetigena]
MADNTPLLGLYPLFQDGGRGWKPNGLDIIAVPGLDGHPFATWTASASAENSMVGPLWLRDFLPSENLPDARVYSYGYDAKSWLTESKGSGLRTFSHLLLQSLVWARDGRLSNRPLVFVCHGVGGLVVKQALVTAHINQKEYPGVHSSVKGVMFLGVPHRGAGSLTVHQIMADMLVLGGLKAALPPGPDLLKKLQAEPGGIDKLSTDFRNHIKSHVVLVSCYEEVNMNKNGSERCLVPRESAILDVPGEKIIPMISCNHVTMVKFYTRNDHNYKNVAFAIAEAAKLTESPSIAKPAPSKKELDPAAKKQTQQDSKKGIKPGAKPEANSTAKREPPAVVPKVPDTSKKTMEPTIKEAQSEPKKKEETIAGLRECLASLKQACQQVSPQSKPKELDTLTSLPFTIDRVSKNAQYRQWLNSSTNSLLVIQGETGSGKTTLARQISKNITASQPKTLVLGYSFKETSAVNLAGEQWRLCFWSSLAHQLMSHKPESLKRLIRRHHRLRIALTPGFLPVWKPDELLEAISREALPCALKDRNVLIFVDGVDVCEKPDELLDDLQKCLLQNSSPTPTSGAKPTETSRRFCSKICVTSTRELAAKEKGHMQSIHMGENNVEDLEAYVYRQLEQVCALDQKGVILQRAQRSFLWARLLCEQAQQSIQQKPLESAKQPRDLYQHNLDALSPAQKSRGLNMIKWATFASRPLTLPELFVAVEMDGKIDSDMTNLSGIFSPQQGGASQLLAREADMEGIVKHLSRGLLSVTADATSGRKVVRPIHNSLAQLVMPPKVAAEKVEKDTVSPSPESFVHLSMVSTCLRFLNIAMRDLQWRSRGSQGPCATKTSATRPELAFSEYAESFWFRHAHIVEAGAGTLNPCLKWFGFTSSDGDRFLEDFIELARSRALGPLVSSLSGPQREQKTKESQGKQADRAFEGAGWLHMFALYGLRTPLPAVSKARQVRKVDSRDQTPLHYAALQNHRPVVKSLIAYAQDRDQLGNTPLHLAAMQGNVDALKAILKYSTVKNLANTPNSAGYMPLHHAVYYEHRSAAKALLDEKVGAQVDARLPNGKTSLMLAAEVGSHALAAVLLDAKSGGADINAADESGQTALSAAVLSDNYSVVKLLVLRKTCAVDKADRDRRTPLMHAVRCGNLAAAKLLLDKRTLEEKVADVNAADGRQLTALLLAVSSLRVTLSDGWVGADAAAKVSDRMVKLLVDSGAQVMCHDTEKRTSVAIALEAAKKQTGNDADKALAVAGLLFAAYEKTKGADVAKWDRDWAESNSEYQAIRNKQTPSAAPKTKDSVAKPPAGASKSAAKLDAPDTGTVAATATAAQAKLQINEKVGSAPAKLQPANGTTAIAAKNPAPSAQTKAQTETPSAATAGTNGAITAAKAKKGPEANTAAPLAAKQVVSPDTVPRQPLSKAPAGEKAAGIVKATLVVTQAVNPAKSAVAKPAAAADASSAKGAGETKPSAQPIPQAKGLADIKSAPLALVATNPPPPTAAKTTSSGPVLVANGQKLFVSQTAAAAIVSLKQAPGPVATPKASAKSAFVGQPSEKQTAAQLPKTAAPQMPASGPVKRKHIQPTAAANPACASRPASSQPYVGALAQKQSQQQPEGIQKSTGQRQPSKQQHPPVPPKGGVLPKPMPPPKPASSSANALQEQKPGDWLPSSPQVQKEAVPAPFVRPAAGPTTRPSQQLQSNTFQQSKPAPKEPPRLAQQPSKEQHQRAPFSDMFSSGKEKEKNDKPPPPTLVQGKGLVNRAPSIPQKSEPPKHSVALFAPREDPQISPVSPFQGASAQNYPLYSQVPASQQHIVNYAAPQFYKQPQRSHHGYAQEGQFPSSYQQRYFGDEHSQKLHTEFDQRSGIGQTRYSDLSHSQQGRDVNLNTQGQSGRDPNTRSVFRPVVLAGGAGLAAGAGTVLVYNMMQSQNNEPEQSERAISPNSRTRSSYMKSQYPTEHSTHGSQYQTELSTYGTENEYQPVDGTNHFFVAADDLYPRSVQKHEGPHEVKDIEIEKEAHVASDYISKGLALDIVDDVHSIPSPVSFTPSSPAFDRRSIDLGLEGDLAREDDDSLESHGSPQSLFEPDVGTQQFVWQSIQLKEEPKQTEDEELEVPDSSLSDRGPSCPPLSIAPVNLAEYPNDDGDGRRSVMSRLGSHPSSRGFPPSSPDFPESEDENLPDNYTFSRLAEHDDDLQNFVGQSDDRAKDDENSAKSLQSFTLNANEAGDNDEDHDKVHNTGMLDDEFDGMVSDDEAPEQGHVHKYKDEIETPENRSLFGDDGLQNNAGILDRDEGNEEDSRSSQGHDDLEDAAGNHIDRLSQAGRESRGGSEFGDGPHESHMQDGNLSLHDDGISDRDDDDNYSQGAHDDNHSDHYDAHGIDGQADMAGYAVPDKSPTFSHRQDHEHGEEYYMSAGGGEYHRQPLQGDHPDMHDGNDDYYSHQTGEGQSQGCHDQHHPRQYLGSQFSQHLDVEEDEYDSQQDPTHSRRADVPITSMNKRLKTALAIQAAQAPGKKRMLRITAVEHTTMTATGHPRNTMTKHKLTQDMSQTMKGKDDDDCCVDDTNDMQPGLDIEDDKIQSGEYSDDVGQMDYDGKQRGTLGGDEASDY